MIKFPEIPISFIVYCYDNPGLLVVFGIILGTGIIALVTSIKKNSKNKNA